MSINKNIARLRRAKSTRSHIRELGVARLSVLRTGQHLYAQVFTADGSKVIAAANTLQADVKDGLKNGKNSDAAVKVGKLIAERAKVPVSRRSHSTARATATTAASRRLPTLRAKAACSSKHCCGCGHRPHPRYRRQGTAGSSRSSATVPGTLRDSTTISGREPYILNQSRNQDGRRTCTAGS